MTVLVVALFLPHTIHFDVSKDDTPPTSAISRNPSQVRVGDYQELTSPPLPPPPPPPSPPSSTVFEAASVSMPTPPQTRPTSSSKEHEDFFKPAKDDGGGNGGGGGGGATGLGTKVMRITLPKNPSMASLASPNPTEPHSPAWGRTSYFMQPKSRAESPPSALVLNQFHDDGVVLLPSCKKAVVRQSRADSHERVLRAADWSVQPAEQGNGGLRNAIQAGMVEGTIKDKILVGTLGMPTDALGQEKKTEISDKLANEYDCLTVYSTDSDFNGHYSHFCKKILWPVLHYQIPDSPKSKAYEDHSWVYYVKINELFAESIVKSWKKGDVIWIHDYHLLLVPGMVRKKIPEAQIGFFMHVAFPSSEVFRCLAVRKDLLEGMLGSNLIGFQTQEYCRHFLQTCNRLLCVEANRDGVQLEDRFVNVATVPIGIDLTALNQRRKDEEVQEWLRKILTKYAGKHLIVARDKLDHIRGVRQKLLSYELFLNRYPEYRENVVLIQVATSTTTEKEKNPLDAAVSEIVTRINAQYSTLAHQPLVFLKQDMEYAQYLAMLMAADALMITSLREGMNLTSHEFLVCQDGAYGEKSHGSLVLSEFTGSAAVLSKGKALSVNPWDYRQCAEAIRKTITMEPAERAERWKSLMESCVLYSAEHWLATFLEKLRCAWERQSRQHTVAIPRLNVPELSDKYNAARRRLFMLDYEGTLTPTPTPHAAVVSPTTPTMDPGSLHPSPQRTIDALTNLLYDSRNTVYVMSGQRPEELDDIFRGVPGLGLIAENGCFVKEAAAPAVLGSRGNDDEEKEWHEVADISRMQAWKTSIRKIVNYYKERTEGSWIEERHCSLVFNYGSARDPVAAARQAGECADHINNVASCASSLSSASLSSLASSASSSSSSSSALGVHAVHLDGAVLIESTAWNKETAASHIFKSLVRGKAGSGASGGERMPDFLMAAGDAREDEVIYRWANALERDGVVKEVITVSVASRNTEAKFTLAQGVTGVLSALQRLAGPSKLRDY